METRRPVVADAEEVIDRYFPVLDHGFVALKDYMGSDASVVEAARVSYGEGTRHISTDRHLLRFLYRKRHSSPFEMVEAQFHIGLPIFVMRQFIRHRTANINEYSGRYSVMPLMYYTPDETELCYQSKTNRQGSGKNVDMDVYGKFLTRSSITRKNASEGYKYALDNDIARELARIDLPLSTYTYCYWKIDLRNMFNIMSLRDDSHAQKQIRDYAHVFGGIIKRLTPLSLDAFQDYQQNAVTFSQAEMAGMRALALFHASPIAWENPSPLVRQTVNEVLETHGLEFTKSGGESREMGEFWDKLKVRTKKNYDLDLSVARDGSYYRELVQKHAYEVPQSA